VKYYENTNERFCIRTILFKVFIVLELYDAIFIVQRHANLGDGKTRVFNAIVLCFPGRIFNTVSKYHYLKVKVGFMHKIILWRQYN